MKKSIRYIPLLALVMLLTASCSKQSQLENILTQQAGRWNVDNKKITITTTNLPVDVTEYGDCGYVYFFDNGEGQWIDLTTPDNTLFIEFNWSINENNNLLIEYNNEEFEYRFDVNEKDRQVLVYTQTVQVTDTISTTTEVELELLRIQ